MTDEMFRKQAIQMCESLDIDCDDPDEFDEAVNYVEHNLRTAYRAGAQFAVKETAK